MCEFEKHKLSNAHEKHNLSLVKTLIELSIIKEKSIKKSAFVVAS